MEALHVRYVFHCVHCGEISSSNLYYEYIFGRARFSLRTNLEVFMLRVFIFGNLAFHNVHRKALSFP